MTKEKRISVALNKDYLKKLDDICNILHVKQYSKAIKVMIDTFLYVNTD